MRQIEHSDFSTASDSHGLYDFTAALDSLYIQNETYQHFDCLCVRHAVIFLNYDRVEVTYDNVTTI